MRNKAKMRKISFFERILNKRKNLKTIGIEKPLPYTDDMLLKDESDFIDECKLNGDRCYCHYWMN